MSSPMLSPEKLIECEKSALEKVESEAVPVIEVPHKCPGQEYSVVSIIGTKTRQKSDTACMQILGNFATLEAAQTFTREVGKKSPAFDIYVAPMFKWLPINTSPDDAQNVEYCNDKVDELMKDYRLRKAMSDEVFEERKRQDKLAGADKAAPSESAPSESAPSESAPSESAPSESAPAESAPSESAPSELQHKT